MFRTRVLAILTAIALVAPAPAALAQDAPISAPPPVDPPGWFLVANHLHTSVGGDHSWHAGLSHLLNKANALGIDFAIITDHNTIDHWFFPEFVPHGRTIPVPGEEWTTPEGHAGLVAFRAENARHAIWPCTKPGSPHPCPTTRAGPAVRPEAGPKGPLAASGRPPDYRRMVDEVHRRGGLVFINHPKLIRHVWPDDTFGADAIDIGWNLSDPLGDRGRGWWHALLVRGIRIGAVGGSDYHYFLWPHEKPAPGDDPRVPLVCGDATPNAPASGRVTPVPELEKPVNLVRAGERTGAAVVEAMRRNRTIVLRHPGAPRAFLGADLDGDGRFDDAREGDSIPALPGQTIRFQARVTGGDGRALRILGPTASSTVRVTGTDFVHSFALTRGPAPAFVRLEIGSHGECAGNPIWY
jgi:hypothetical protein